MEKKISVKYMLNQSGVLFLAFLIGAVLISSLQETEITFKTLFIRFLTLGTFFTAIYIVNICLIYYFDRNRKKEKERIWKKTFICGYIFSLIMMFVQNIFLYYLHKIGVEGLDHTPAINDELGGWRYIVFVMYASLILYTFVFLVQNFVLSQFEKDKIKTTLLKLEASNAAATNQLLQQQIQPHFLFNALNILKSLIRRDPKNAEAYLLRLSDFLRVSISKNTTGKALVKDELKVCRDYMEMQQIRFGEAIQYKVYIDEQNEVMNAKLPFFSLQPLLENAIKHNELTESNPLIISIRQEGDCIVVSNNLQPKTYAEVSTGNGHSMLQKRYSILSGDDLLIVKGKETYKVCLKILA